MSSEDLITIVAVLGGIILFTVVLTVGAVRSRRKSDAESFALRASDVVAQTKGLLAGPDFLWAVWHKTTDVAALQMQIRNQRDDVLGTVIKPTVVLDGVLKRFDFDGKQYEVRKPGVMTNRTHLSEAGRDEVLLSAEHNTFSTRFFRGKETEVLCIVRSGSVFTRFLPIESEDREIGKMIVGVRQDSTVRILSVPDNRLSRLEQVFVLVK